MTTSFYCDECLCFVSPRKIDTRLHKSDPVDYDYVCPKCNNSVTYIGEEKTCLPPPTKRDLNCF